MRKFSPARREPFSAGNSPPLPRDARTMGLSTHASRRARALYQQQNTYENYLSLPYWLDVFYITEIPVLDA